VLISNFLLPKLVSCAEQILFEGESGRPFPTQRAQLVLGFIFIIYLLNIHSCKRLCLIPGLETAQISRDRYIPTLCPLCYFENHYWFGAAHSHSAPGSPSHRSPCGMAGDLPRIIAFEPGVSTMLMTALLFGALRNIARLVMVLRLRHF